MNAVPPSVVGPPTLADPLARAQAAAAGLAAASRYWEQRAQRFGARGEGLGAVCSYGMPEFYNRIIQLTQRLALAPWLRVPPGTRVLDVGCGVGRWSTVLATRGARVTGVDLSPTMIAIAERRARAAGLADRCRFEVQDLPQLNAGGPFDLILGVTVLQHILDPGRLHEALTRLRTHLAPAGRMVLLEAAPARPTDRCDSAVFTARDRTSYLRWFEAAGLRVRSIGGVDPAPFKTWLLPHLQTLPRALGLAALAAASALSLPIDVPFGRRAVAHSWHALFVLGPAQGDVGAP